MVESRIVLEKVKALESKMRYQIEKLVRLAKESPANAEDVMNGMFA
jgi:U3 small nucleolar ribonucleoprotein protein LCP5